MSFCISRFKEKDRKKEREGERARERETENMSLQFRSIKPSYFHSPIKARKGRRALVPGGGLTRLLSLGEEDRERELET